MGSDTLLKWLETHDTPTDFAFEAEPWPVPTNLTLVNERGAPAITSDPGPLFVIDERTRWARARGILTAFLRLATASDAKILKFAERYGLLSLCKHRLPDGHFHAYPPTGFDCGADRARRTVEPTRWYRRYARLVGAMLRIAECYRRDRPDFFVEDLWAIEKFWRRYNAAQRSYRDSLKDHPPQVRGQQLTPVWEGGGPRPTIDYRNARHATVNLVRGARYPGSREFAAEQAIKIANWWLYVGGVRPTLGGRLGAPALVWPGGAWAAIGAQFAAALLRDPLSASCANCGAAVRRDRRPQAKRRVWCDDKECQRVAAKQRQQERRRRMRVHVSSDLPQ